MLYEVITTLTWVVEGQANGTFAPVGNAFRADAVPVSPYQADGKFLPYPLAVVQARDASGKLLAETKVSLPMSTELSCKNCHGGPWTHGVAGISGATAADILKSHDRMNLTDLSGRGGQIVCRSCHQDADSPDKRIPNLSTAIHSLHAVYLAGRGADACHMCHPTNPEGATLV